MVRGLVFWQVVIKQTMVFEVKKTLMMDLFLTNMQLFTSHNINWRAGVVWITCGLLWCFYQLFGLSFWRHPFTAKYPLVSKWCNVKFLQSFPMINKLIYILDGLRACTFLANFHFWLNYSFNSNHSPAEGHCSFLYIRELCSGLCIFGLSWVNSAADSPCLMALPGVI